MQKPVQGPVWAFAPMACLYADAEGFPHLVQKKQLLLTRDDVHCSP